MSNEFTIDYYRDQDRVSLERFFARVWTPPPYRKGQDWFRWQFQGNPNAAKSRVPLIVAHHREEIVGMLALIPTPLWIKGKRHDVAWGRDFFVEPSYRRQKLGLRLNERWVDDFEAALGAGQSETMLTLQQKHGWHDVSGVNQYEKLLIDWPSVRSSLTNPLRLLRRFGAMTYAALHGTQRPSKDLRIVHGTDFDADADGLWRRCRESYSYMCERDLKTLHWRFLEHPYYKYEVTQAWDKAGMYRGYLVFRLDGPTAWIIDMLSDVGDEDARKGMILAAERKAQSCGVKRFVSHSVCHPLEHALRGCGYIKTGLALRLSLISRRGFPPGNDNDWYVTSFDSDLDR